MCLWWSFSPCGVETCSPLDQPYTIKVVELDVPIFPLIKRISVYVTSLTPCIYIYIYIYIYIHTQ